MRHFHIHRAAAALLLLGASCTAIAGLDGDYVLAPTCGPDTDPCFSCTDQYCCSEFVACHADARCGDYYKTCLPSCQAAGKSPEACVVQCDGQLGAGHALFAPYDACNQANCLAPCTNGGTQDACTNCLWSQCRNDTTGCFGDSACDTLRACVALCQPGTAYQACAAACQDGAPPESAQRYDVMASCALTYCQQSCAITPI